MILPSHMMPLSELPADIEELRGEADGEGFRFVDKLVAEWRSGSNRFARPSEVLLGAFRGVELIAVGGLNHDPYAGQDGVGRLRHLYVKRSARRSGVGTALVRELLKYAETTFHSVRLRTDTREAADFYVALGFQTTQEKTATHVKSLQRG